MPARSALRLVHSTAGAALVGRSLGRGKVLFARDMGAVALRLPERMSSQLQLVVPQSSPRLFVHEGARQALERRLNAAFPGPVMLSITDNRQSIISHSTDGGVLRARIHHMFLDAPPVVVEALVRYVTLGDREASVLIGHYIDANAARLARRDRKVPLNSKGEHHDLLAMFQAINGSYFGGAINAVITWGASGRKRGARRQTIKLGSYSAVDRLIRIHPAIDKAWVPRYFVEYVVFHECLHHLIPASRGEGRRLLHPPEFVVRERTFRQFDRAIAWERKHIARLLRA